MHDKGERAGFQRLHLLDHGLGELVEFLRLTVDQGVDRYLPVQALGLLLRLAVWPARRFMTRYELDVGGHVVPTAKLAEVRIAGSD